MVRPVARVGLAVANPLDGGGPGTVTQRGAKRSPLYPAGVKEAGPELCRSGRLQVTHAGGAPCDGASVMVAVTVRSATSTPRGAGAPGPEAVTRGKAVAAARIKAGAAGVGVRRAEGKRCSVATGRKAGHGLAQAQLLGFTRPSGSAFIRAQGPTAIKGGMGALVKPKRISWRCWLAPCTRLVRGSDGPGTPVSEKGLVAGGAVAAAGGQVGVSFTTAVVLAATSGWRAFFSNAVSSVCSVTAASPATRRTGPQR